MFIEKKLPVKIARMNNQELLKKHKDSQISSSILGYIIGFFIMGLFIFSFMRIFKAQYKHYNNEILKRGLNIVP